MIGIIVIFFVSWLILYLIEKESILSLGLIPSRNNSGQILVSLLLAATLCILSIMFETLLKGSTWVANDGTSASILLKSFWWDLKSVLTEELLFRGAILLILIKRIGPTKGTLISAIAFGIYHWFSFGLFGNVIAMVFDFLGTGLMGYAWALAFSKSRTILIPTALHLGWNFTHNTIFSKGPLGDLLLVSNGGHDLENWYWILNYLVGNLTIAFLFILYVRYFVRQVE